MFSNYLRIIFRSLKRQKFYAFINITGLSVSLTSVILIMLFVTHELSYDKFHPHARNIYRLVEHQYYTGKPVFPVAVTPGPLGASLQQEYPEVEAFTRVQTTTITFTKGDIKITEDGVLADPSILRMFSLPLVAGDTATALTHPMQIVISETMAQKYFASQSALGESLTLHNTDFVISGIMKDIPDNAQFDFDFILPIMVGIYARPNAYELWGSNFLYTYVRLQEGTDATMLNKKIKDHIKKFNERSVADLYLQPLTDVHLSSTAYTADLPGKGNVTYVSIFCVVALLILLVACINFMNLTTAQSMKRAKEVGLRKTIGANRWQLALRFLGESLAITTLSLLLAVILTGSLLPFFNVLAEKHFTLQTLFTNPYFAVGMVMITLATGLLSGSYPAFYLSAFKPMQVLKGKLAQNTGSGLFRKSLVVIQFSISTIMIGGTVVVLWQMQYIKNTNPGYARENVVIIDNASEHGESLKHLLAESPNIQSATFINQSILHVNNSSTTYSWQGKPEGEAILIHQLLVDEDFIETMKIEIKEGRSFSQTNDTDSTSIIINEQAAAIMGFDEPLGQVLRYDHRSFTVIGVARDFNFKSVHNKIEPLIITKTNKFMQDESIIAIRIAPNRVTTALAAIEKAWKTVNPGLEFNYSFLDTDFDNLYKAESRIAMIFKYFAALAIIISCLGLFALTAYAAEQRAREFSIRKVLGASLAQIFSLASIQYLVLVGIAFVIAVPVCWYFMNEWLSSFAYRITIDYKVFVVSGLLVMLIAFLTVTYQAIRSSQVNPAQNLRGD